MYLGKHFGIIDQLEILFDWFEDVMEISSVEISAEIGENPMAENCPKRKITRRELYRICRPIAEHMRKIVFPVHNLRISEPLRKIMNYDMIALRNLQCGGVIGFA